MSRERLRCLPFINIGVDLLVDKLAQCLPHLPVLLCVDGLLTWIHSGQTVTASAQLPNRQGQRKGERRKMRDTVKKIVEIRSRI